MRENTVKSIWAKGGVVVNGWLSIPSSFSAEVMAHQGFDSLVVDMQHGVVDYQTAVTMLQAISTTGVIPFARVPWNDPAHIMKILDAGAYGIICPMINSRKEAEQLVRTCKYAPKGYRSFGPVRASIYAGSDYALHANDTIVVMPMIETKEAVQNIDEILSTPGVDAIYVGPGRPLAHARLHAEARPDRGAGRRGARQDPGRLQAPQGDRRPPQRDERLRPQDGQPGLAVRDAGERQPVPRRAGGRGSRRREADGGQREAPRVLSAAAGISSAGAGERSAR